MNGSTKGCVVSLRGLTARRLGLASVAFVGTAVYVASFALVPRPSKLGAGELADLARRVGVCAGLAWVVFGVLLLAISRRATIGEWADICLSTMAVGIGVMMLGAAFNASVRFCVDPASAAVLVRGVQAAVLLVADAAMCVWFASRASPRYSSRAGAAAAWVFGLNGIFALLMVIVP